MNKIPLLIALLILAGCNTPSIPFRGIAPSTITVDGSTFDVRVKALRAEAIRTNVQYAPRLGPIGQRADAAIERVSGCRVSRSKGDQAVIVAALDCGAGAPPIVPNAPDYECYSVGGIDLSNDGYSDLVLDCSAQRRS